MLKEYMVWFDDGDIEVVEAHHAVDAMLKARELHVGKGMTWVIHSVHLLCIMRKVA